MFGMGGIVGFVFILLPHIIAPWGRTVENHFYPLLIRIFPPANNGFILILVPFLIIFSPIPLIFALTYWKGRQDTITRSFPTFLFFSVAAFSLGLTMIHGVWVGIAMIALSNWTLF